MDNNDLATVNILVCRQNPIGVKTEWLRSKIQPRTQAAEMKARGIACWNFTTAQYSGGAALVRDS